MTTNYNIKSSKKLKNYGGKIFSFEDIDLSPPHSAPSSSDEIKRLNKENAELKQLLEDAQQEINDLKKEINDLNKMLDQVS
jgi:hypothetical protein